MKFKKLKNIKFHFIIERLLLPCLLLFLPMEILEMEEINGRNSINTSNNIFYNINNVNLLYYRDIILIGLLIIIIRNLRISFPNNYH